MENVKGVRLANIERLIKERFGGVVSKFAKAIRKAPSQVHQWQTEVRTISEDSARSIEAALGLPNGSLDDSDTLGMAEARPDEAAAPVDDAGEDDLVFVGFYPDAAVSAGAGATNHAEGRRLDLAFRAESLRRKGVNAAKSAVIPVRGRSMEPLLSPGDVVLFDTSQTRIHDGEVYVVHWNGEELVKLLRPLSGGRVQLVSKNPEFEPLIADQSDGDFRVLGRVMWRSGWM